MLSGEPNTVLRPMQATIERQSIHEYQLSCLGRAGGAHRLLVLLGRCSLSAVLSRSMLRSIPPPLSLSVLPPLSRLRSRLPPRTVLRSRLRLSLLRGTGNREGDQAMGTAGATKRPTKFEEVGVGSDRLQGQTYRCTELSRFPHQRRLQQPCLPMRVALSAMNVATSLSQSSHEGVLPYVSRQSCSPGALAHWRSPWGFRRKKRNRQKA